MDTSICSQCPRHNGVACTPVLDVGPEPCAVLLVGAGPGKVESQTLTPYTGLAGEELTQTYLALAGLERFADVHIANSTLCWDGTDRTPSTKRVESCAHLHLVDVIARVKPEVIVLMGGAVQCLSDVRVRLDMQHGIPFYGSVLGGQWTCWIWPSYEPALGMRETSRMTQLLEDFRNLGRWMRGEWTAPTTHTEFETPDYGVAETKRDVREYFGLHEQTGRGQVRRIAVDTETHGRRPWSVQFSVRAGTGRMILADNRSALQELGVWMCGRELILHNAPGDLDTLDRMGLGKFVGAYRDTMQEAFQLCSLPQGLKALAYRLLGVTMRSWEDVVRPTSVRKLEEWVERATGIAAEELVETSVTQLKRARCLDCGHQHTTGKCKSVAESRTTVYPDGTSGTTDYPCGCESTRHSTVRTESKPGSLESILRHVSRYLISTKDADDPYDGWDALWRMRRDGLRGRVADEFEWEYLEQRCGPIPILGIGNCRLEEAVTYGCSDADHTWQVAQELEKLRHDSKWKVDEEDKDK